MDLQQPSLPASQSLMDYFEWDPQETDPELSQQFEKKADTDVAISSANPENRLITNKDLEENMLLRKEPTELQTFGSFSQVERRVSERQPPFHSSTKGCKESVFFCCVTSNDLNLRENRLYNRFKDTMIHSYDPKNQVHENHLAHLYYISNNL